MKAECGGTIGNDTACQPVATKKKEKEKEKNTMHILKHVCECACTGDGTAAHVSWGRRLRHRGIARTHGARCAAAASTE